MKYISACEIKTGFGRLIRIETDTGVIAILDFRVNQNGTYRRNVIDVLPPCEITGKIYTLEKFMRLNKLPAYFTQYAIAE